MDSYTGDVSRIGEVVLDVADGRWEPAFEAALAHPVRSAPDLGTHHADDPKAHPQGTPPHLVKEVVNDVPGAACLAPARSARCQSPDVYFRWRLSR